jgi:hypothetical protein
MELLFTKDKLFVVNIVLTIGILVVMFLLVFSIVMTNHNQELLPRAASESLAKTEGGTAVSLQGLSVYKKIVTSRELFRPTVFNKEQDAPEITIDDLTKDLMLTGIVAQDKKEAIVKNRRTRETYFVTVNATIGDVKVISIGDDKIRLAYKQEQKDLFLQ